MSLTSPEELRRLIARTEEAPRDPAVARAWSQVARALGAAPYQRVWVEEILGAMFVERAEAGGAGIAVLCNIARQCRCAGLGPLLGATLDTALEGWSDADVRALMGALLELAPEHAAIASIAAHGRRPDVLAVAVHLLAARDPAEAAVFLRAGIASALAAALHPERIWDSLAKLCARRPAHRRRFVQALAILGDAQRGAYRAAVGALSAPGPEHNREADDDIVAALLADIDTHWPQEADRMSETPHPESIELVRAFLDAALAGDDDAALALLVHPDRVQDLGAGAVGYAQMVRDGAPAFLASLRDWPVVERVGEPVSLGPGLGDAVMFQLDVTLAGSDGETTTIPIVVLEHGASRAIALPVRAE